MFRILYLILFFSKISLCQISRLSQVRYLDPFANPPQDPDTFVWQITGNSSSCPIGSITPGYSGTVELIR
jgi:hypothetical protein